MRRAEDVGDNQPPFGPDAVEGGGAALGRFDAETARDEHLDIRLDLLVDRKAAVDTNQLRRVRDEALEHLEHGRVPQLLVVEELQGVEEERAVNDVLRAVVLGAQARHIDVRRGRVVVVPLQIIRQPKAPGPKGIVARIAKRQGEACVVPIYCRQR